MIDEVVTGKNKSQFNGPLQSPIWNGYAGTRPGELAYDDTGTLDGTPGFIVWTGFVWQRYSASTDIPNLQQVTDQGPDTDVNITIYKLLVEQIAQIILTNSDALSSLQAMMTDLGSGPVSLSQLLLQADNARIVLQTNTPLQVYNDSGGLLFTISGNGRRITFQNGVSQITGSGSPEGVETATVSSTFQQLNGAPGACFWIKQSGSGNTGWAPLA